jgi:hypothetical protein
MSGSYQQLLQKYNQLLALVLNIPVGVDTLQSVVTANDELQGVSPSTNDVIKYNGTNVVWATDAGTQNLEDVLTVGNTSTIGLSIQVGTNTLSIDNNSLIVSDSLAGKASTVDNDIISIINVTTLDGIKLDYLASPFIRVTETGITSDLFTNELRFTRITGLPPVSNVVGMSITSTNGLELTTNGTLTLGGLGGSDGQFLKRSSGNAVWDSLPSIPTVKASSVVIGVSDTTGTISFGFTFALAPTVTISQVTSGNIIALSIVSTTTTGFTWKSTASGVGNINWIATL